jgi:hypothetical protein
MAELEARRRALLARCEVQRIDLARRIARLYEEAGRAGFWARGADGSLRFARHPLAWIAALAGLSLLGRTRNVLTLLTWVRTGLTIASRVAQVLGLIGALRARRSARRSARGRTAPGAAGV